MSKLREFLSGYKTYIVMAAAILTAVGGYAGGELSLEGLIIAVFAAVGTITLRAGVAKGGK